MFFHALFHLSRVFLVALSPILFANDLCTWGSIPNLDKNGFLPTEDWCHACCADGLAQHPFCGTCCDSGSEYYANLICLSHKRQTCHLPLDSSRSISCCGSESEAACVGIPLALLSKSTSSMQNKIINCTSNAQANHYCMRGYTYDRGLCIWPKNSGSPTLYCQAAAKLINSDLPHCYDPKHWEGQLPRKLTHANNTACPYDANGNMVTTVTTKTQKSSESQQTSAQTDERSKERGEARRLNRRYQRRRDYYDQQ